MAALKNEKQEKFVNLVAAGNPASRAYVSAGYTASNENAAAASSSRLLKTAKVAARLAELQPVAVARIEAAISQVVENDLMTRVGRAKEVYSRILLMRQVILERAEYYSKQEYAANMPGAGTGLIVARHKMIGSGVAAERTIEFELDRALLSELRECENQMAVELGQRVDKNPAGAYSSLREVPAEVLAQWRVEAAAAAAHEAKAAAKAGTDPSPVVN